MLDLKLGISDLTLLHVIHPDAPKLLQYKTNLKEVCADLSGLDASATAIIVVFAFYCLMIHNLVHIFVFAIHANEVAKGVTFKRC